jgi:hypothetical protein
MNLYYYIFSCAYWVSIKDLKEDYKSQEYGVLFVSIAAILLFLALANLISFGLGYNILNRFSVIIGGVLIYSFNYVCFHRKKRYLKVISNFAYASYPTYKKRRITVLILTYGLCSIFTAITSFMMNRLLH